MNSTIDSIHYKITVKFDCLNDISIYLKKILNKYQSIILSKKQKNKKIKSNSIKTPNSITESHNYSQLGQDNYDINNFINELDIIFDKITSLYYKYNNVTSPILFI